MANSYLVLPTNRPDVADWLDEMLGNGWRLVSVYEGIFYFENMDAIIARTAEAVQRDYKANGSMRQTLETAADAGVARARRELRL